MFMTRGRAHCPRCKTYTFHTAGESALTDTAWSECLECGLYETENVAYPLANHGRTVPPDRLVSQGIYL
jgi:hypothetical protein